MDDISSNGKVVWWQITIAILLPKIGGLLSSIVTRKNLNDWYENLNFPEYRPPNWLFAPVWVLLYMCIGYASYIVWRDGCGFAGNRTKLPLIVYIVQLLLNWAWTIIFFGFRNIFGALIDIVALTILAIICCILFYKVNHMAGYLFIPYIAWLSFATVLNYSMLTLNPTA